VTDFSEFAPCAILAFDAESGDITHANQFCCQALGYSLGELQCLKFDDILTVSARIFHQTHFLPLLRLHGKAEEIFVMLREKSGEAVPMLANAVLETGHDRPHSLVVCAFLPVHQRRKYEDEILAAKRKAEEALNNNEELKRSRHELEQRLQQLDANLLALERRNRELLRLGEIFSHDLREPIRKIRTFSDLLREELNPQMNEGAVAPLNRINASCERAAELLRTLQEYLWLDLDPELPSTVDLNDIVRVARGRIASPFTLSAENLPSAPGRSRQLALLFEHLFRSAVARARSSELHVSIEWRQIQENRFQSISDKYSYIDFAQIIVSDDAEPFAPEEGGSLFELLHKHSGNAPHPDLGICRKIAENHRGSITLDTSRRTGAAFKILLALRDSSDQDVI
jgi:sigma-B regulation protein RsbU (phosphoserine phosphatase)